MTERRNSVRQRLSFLGPRMPNVLQLVLLHCFCFNFVSFIRLRLLLLLFLFLLLLKKLVLAGPVHEGLELRESEFSAFDDFGNVDAAL